MNNSMNGCVLKRCSDQRVKMVKRNYVICFSLILIFSGLFVRAKNLFSDSLFFDEMFVLSRANNYSVNSRSVFFKIKNDSYVTAYDLLAPLYSGKEDNYFQSSFEYLKNFTHVSNHPPLNTLFVKMFTHFRNDYFALRIYAFCTYLLLLFSIFYFTAVFSAQKTTALLAVALFNVSDFTYELASFPKGYSLALFFGLMAAAFVVKANKNNSKLFLFAACLLIYSSFLTHYLIGFFFTIAALVLYNFYKPFNRSMFTKTIIHSTIFVASFLIYIPLYLEQDKLGFNHIFSNCFNFNKSSNVFMSLMKDFLLFNNQTGWVSIIIVLNLIVLIFFNRKSFDRKKYLLLFFIFSPFVILFCVNLFADTCIGHLYRYCLMALIFVFVFYASLLYKKEFIFSTCFLLLSSLHLFMAPKKFSRKINYIPRRLSKAIKKIKHFDLSQPILIQHSSHYFLSGIALHYGVTHFQEKSVLSAIDINDPVLKRVVICTRRCSKPIKNIIERDFPDINVVKLF